MPRTAGPRRPLLSVGRDRFIHMFGGVLLKGAVESAALSADDVRSWAERLADEGTTGSDAALVEQIECLERLKSAAAARQAQLTAAFAASQRAVQRAAGTHADEISRGIGAQVALARHDSPHSGNRHLGVAEALVHEMPKTFAALRAGDTSEYRASLLVRESACLAKEHRAALDSELGPRLLGMGNTRVERESRKLAYRLDPGATLRRTRGAEADRSVSIRPAPDVMSRLTGFLPAAQGVAAYASLRTMPTG